MDQIKAILERFLSLDDVVLAVIAGTEGLVIESAERDGADAEAIAAMAVCTLRQARGLAHEIGCDKLIDEIIELEHGLIIFEPLADLAVLVVLTKSISSLGLVRRTARRERQSLEDALAA